MAIRRPDRPSRRRPSRLWPLLFLPLAGLIGGFLAGRQSVLYSGHRGGADVAVHAATGLAAGSLLMALVALGVLAARLGLRQFRIRTILIGVALFALVLGAIRACGP